MFKQAFFGSLCFFFIASPLVNQVDASSLQKEKVIITFKGEIDYETLEDFNIEIKNEFENIPSVSAEIPKYIANTLAVDSSILSIEKDVLVKLNQEVTDYGNVMVKAPNAWSANYTGKNVKIGVIDTGVDIDHSDLTITSGVSFTEEKDGYKGYDDYNGHGTHVAGIIGANHNGFGTKGISPNAEIYAIKTFSASGTAYASTIIQGVDWAINQNMDIINMSIGFQEPVPALETLLKTAESKGILLVAASGNDGVSDKTKNNIDYPARYDSVIGVGAVNENRTRANFDEDGTLGTAESWSSTGPSIDVVAPGHTIASTYRDDQYIYMSGTSMAAPYVSGLLALLKEAYPNLSAKELRNLLTTNAVDLGPKGKDVEFGYGLVQFSKDTENKLEVASLKENHTDTSVTLSWKNPGEDFKEVKIYKNGTLLTKTNASSYKDVSLTPNTSYLYKVTTLDTTGNESAGTTITVKTDEAYPLPKQVEDVTATAKENSITLTWERPIDEHIKEVKVLRDGVVKFTSATETIYEEFNLQAATNYRYELVTVSTKGKESSPVAVNVTTKNPATPSIVTGVKATADFKKEEIHLSWNKAKESNIIGYYVYADDTQLTDEPIQGTNTSFAFDRIQPKQKAMFTVRAVNDLNNLSNVSTGVSVDIQQKLRFTDVKDKHWAYEDIRFVSNQNWMGGVGNNTSFKPSKSLTRAEAAAIFVRALGLQAKNPIKASFVDVSNKHWAYEDIEIAKQHGVFSGTGKQQFSPDKNITRREMAVVLNRIIHQNQTVAKTTSPFKDVTDKDWAKGAIFAMADKKIFSGYADGNFKPNKNITRDETAALMQRSAPYFKK